MARNSRLAKRLAEEQRERERIAALQAQVSDFLVHVTGDPNCEGVNKMTLKSIACKPVCLADVESHDKSPFEIQEALEYNWRSEQYRHFCIWFVTPITGAGLKYGGDASQQLEAIIPFSKLCDAWEEFKRAEKALEGSLW